MNIVLIGYGKMGKSIAAIAPTQGCHVIATIAPNDPEASFSSVKDPSAKEILIQADVCIDFSSSHCVLENIRFLSDLKKNLVVGTTGWEEEMKEARDLVEKAGTGLIFSSNFAVGVQLFIKIIQEAAKIMSSFADYDVGGYELHHNQKSDSPSGTAKVIVDSLLKEIPHKQKALYTPVQRPLLHEELHFSSLRCGNLPGTHTVLFDSSCDTITLTHQSRNREGFARGALLAAKWIANKKGFFTIHDLIHDLTTHSL